MGLRCSWRAAPTKKLRSAGPSAQRFHGIAQGEDEGRFLAQLRAVQPYQKPTILPIIMTLLEGKDRS
jgi:hypothetical protein